MKRTYTNFSIPEEQIQVVSYVENTPLTNFIPLCQYDAQKIEDIVQTRVLYPIKEREHVQFATFEGMNKLLFFCCNNCYVEDIRISNTNVTLQHIDHTNTFIFNLYNIEDRHPDYFPKQFMIINNPVTMELYPDDPMSAMKIINMINSDKPLQERYQDMNYFVFCEGILYQYTLLKNGDETLYIKKLFDCTKPVKETQKTFKGVTQLLTYTNKENMGISDYSKTAILNDKNIEQIKSKQLLTIPPYFTKCSHTF